MQLGREGWVSVSKTPETPISDCFFLVGAEGVSWETLTNSENPEGTWVMGGGKLSGLRLNLG